MRGPGLFLVVLVVGALGGCLGTAVPSNTPSPAADPTRMGTEPMPSPGPVPMVPASPPPVRVAAGRTTPYTDPGGVVWAADSGASGGTTTASATPIAISGTTTPELYNSERYGAFSYTLSLADGNYTLNLGFAEVYLTAAGQRLFDITVAGQTVESAFDIFVAAGGMNAAVIRSYPVTVTGGQIVIGFVPGAIQNPKVNTIELVPRS